jgi:hypothetical protein
MFRPWFLLSLPLLCFAVGYYLQDRFDFTLSAGSKFFIGDRLGERVDHSNQRAKLSGYAMWEIDL